MTAQIYNLTIPDNWAVVPADELCSKITKGTTPSKNAIDINANIPFLRVNNLRFDGTVNLEENTIFVKAEVHNTFLSRSIAYSGDILMNIVGPPLGKIGMLNNHYYEYNLNQAILIYRADNLQIDRKYFLYWLMGEYAQKWLDIRSKKTSGQKNLTIEICKELPIPVPPLAEQKKIAKILSTWDRAIETVERLITNAQNQKKALMQQLLTGKKRFKEFEGQEWREGRLDDFLKEVKGGGTPDRGNDEYWGDEIPWVTVKDLSSQTISTAKEFITRVGLLNSASNLIEAGTVIIATRMAVGKAIVSTSDVAINQDLKALFPDSNLSSKLLHQMMLYHARRIERLGSGSTVKGIRLEDIKSLEVRVPRTFEEQEKIVLVMEIAEGKISKFYQQARALRTQKKALMQQLLTGKRRVQVEGDNNG